MHRRPHEKLITWQESYKLCLWIYKVTADFPSYERFGLMSQMRRAAYGIPMNLAEGNMKRSLKERAHYFERAHASLEELHCQSRLAADLKYFTERQISTADDKMQRLSFLLTKLHKSITKKSSSDSSASSASSAS